MRGEEYLESLVHRQPKLHGALEQRLPTEALVFFGESNAQLLKHFEAAHDLLLLLFGVECMAVNDSVREFVDRLQDEVHETTFEFPVDGRVDEGRGGRIEVALAPQIAKHDVLFDTEFLGVKLH